MIPQTHNYRIEFYGGPQDGEVIYQRAAPNQTFTLATPTEEGMELHNYVLSWETTLQAKYLYDGVEVP